jgi:hypothetical protein
MRSMLLRFSVAVGVLAAGGLLAAWGGVRGGVRELDTAALSLAGGVEEYYCNLMGGNCNTAHCGAISGCIRCTAPDPINVCAVGSGECTDSEKKCGKVQTGLLPPPNTQCSACVWGPAGNDDCYQDTCP